MSACLPGAGESYDTSLCFEHRVCQPAPLERQPCQPVNLLTCVLTCQHLLVDVEGKRQGVSTC